MIRKNPNLPSVSVQVLKNELSVSNNEIIRNVINNLIAEYQDTGTISENSASNLIGNRPKPPKASTDTQFMDSWLIANKEYERKLCFIKQYVENCVMQMQQ